MKPWFHQQIVNVYTDSSLRNKKTINIENKGNHSTSLKFKCKVVAV